MTDMFHYQIKIVRFYNYNTDGLYDIYVYFCTHLQN